MKKEVCNRCGKPLGNKQIPMKNSITGIDEVGFQPFCFHCGKEPWKKAR